MLLFACVVVMGSCVLVAAVGGGGVSYFVLACLLVGWADCGFVLPCMVGWCWFGLSGVWV